MTHRVWGPYQDYRLVAEALNTSKPIPYSNTGVWEETCENVADALAKMNGPKFDREGFLKICEV